MPERLEHRSLGVPIIPMAGVALVIVLMMMITAQELMSHEDTPVNVPQTETLQKKTEDAVTIAVMESPPNSGEKKFFYNDKEMSLDHLQIKLKDTLNKAEVGMLVVIRADSSAPSEWVIELLGKAKEAGAQRVALATKGHEAKKEEDEEEEK
ncbi:hypothetical protein GF359_01315 [candidate division WOR-3 bacterium]|uniref:Biopolymer transporter ExbD n=1 Tax=candidate division WOR-3 bacterium TaxID=2052148 RepID=A0A9D5K841_UNCW3|nr:hypothetical protein [candidate division WOR-3 bacterium]MBD3363834.1 hypothetical protein [candidate division WOR-3 bacterium]